MKDWNTLASESLVVAESAAMMFGNGLQIVIND